MTVTDKFNHQYGHGRSLGTDLRAGRFRFHWHPDARRYLRVSQTHHAVQVPPDGFVIEVAEPGDLYTHAKELASGSLHTIWWPNTESEGLPQDDIDLLGELALEMIDDGLKVAAFDTEGTRV